ncbi:MAG: hypothetical protein S4CHLAM2_13900 [Chlamydiales bacterium]|nr:hypothetical protein [Chlamydiales bacterium]
MQRNVIWIAFLLIMTGFATWFVVSAGRDLMRYYQISTQVSATVEKWDIKERGPNQYVVQAVYSYDFGGKSYPGSGPVTEAYPNPWAATQALEKMKKRKWSVWINPKVPDQSILDRKFPYKATLSAVILIALSAYFICLGVYAGIKNEQRRH